MSQDRFFSRLKRLDEVHWLADRLPRLTYPLRLLTYAVYRALELLLGRRHPHNRVVAQARRLQGRGASLATTATAAANTAPRRRVLFFTVRGWYVHAGTEAVLAKALQQRGAEPHFFLCGGVLPQCDFKPGTDPRVTRPLCWRCSGFARRLLDAFELPASSLEDLVDDDLRRRARQIVDAVPAAQRGSLVYRGLPLGDLVRPSVNRSLLAGGVGEDAFSQQVYAGFLESAVLFVHVAEGLLDELQPEAVVMTNGLFFAERVLLELARRRGVHAVTYERGMPLHSMLLDHDRPAVDFDLDPHWPAYRDRPLEAAEERRLDAYLAARAGGRVGLVDLWPDMEEDRESIARRLGLDAERPLATLFTNILWDSAVYGRDLAFDGMLDWILTTVRWFAEQPGYQLVIRVHPSEVRIPLAASRDRVADRLAEAMPRLPANVHLVGPREATSSYALLSLSRAALVYTSTIGLEAALLGKPVVVAGRTHYRGRGFTVDVGRRETYGALLEGALAADDGPGATGPNAAGPNATGSSAEAMELARRFAYLFFFRYTQPFPWVVDTPRAERRLAFDDLAALAPGADPVLDRICAGILEGRSFVAAPRAGAAEAQSGG